MLSARLRRLWWGGVLLALVGPAGSAAARALDVLPHSYSRSRQFVVYARDSALRNAVGTLGDDTKSELLRALGLNDDWKLPIVVDLRAPEPGQLDDRPPVRLTLAQTGLGLKIELDVLLGAAGRGTRLRDQLISTILLELAYRDHRELMAGVGYTPPPPWLVEGFSAYVENVETGVAASVYSALLPASQTVSITDFLSRDPTKLDATSHAVYRAYAYSLVSLLVNEMEGGRTGLASFVHDLASLPPDEARSAGVLSQHFPQLAANPDSLEKWWLLGLAHLASADDFRAYSVQETEEHLEQLLTFPGPINRKTTAAKTYRLAEFAKFTPFKQNARLLKPTRAGLTLLTGRANPLSRPIVTGYQQVVLDLMRNRTKGAAERLGELALARRAIVQRREAIADYLNWFEATQVTDPSGAFDDYFRSAQQAEHAPVVHRPDTISAYVDEMDVEFR